MTDRATTKQRVKQLVRRVIGEPYVGKRLKMRNLSRALGAAELSPKRILDAGAGDAAFVYWLADRFPAAHVTAIDIDASAMAACAATRPTKYTERVDFRLGHFSELPSDQFDLVTALDVLEHIDDDSEALANLVRSLRPGGSLVVHVPRDVWTHTDGRQERVPDSEAWRINEGHVRMGYSPERLRSMVESAGCIVADEQVWLRRWGVRAHGFYARVERLMPLRLVTVPFTDLAAVLDRRRPESESNTVFLRATKANGTTVLRER